ncbi:Gluconolactonase [Pseudomonas savastanoi]|uniref:Gluconolactonase n=2 Tax=Pseudomonas syringae group TaxID=136849 RepID=A0A3M5LXL3_PSESS|nr:Gluconolactonase [Pseudomonas savastanoi]RMT52560.1 Gluconolactonase [Pseudomonas savastanoi]
MARPRRLSERACSGCRRPSHRRIPWRTRNSTTGGGWSMAHSGRRYEGKRLNSPNDVVVDKRGGIWFSDPTFGVLNKAESYGGKPEQGGEYVYRYDPEQNQLVRLNTPGLHSPNGLAFSPDQSLLYVADSQLAHDFKNPKLAHSIRVYQVRDGALSNGKVFAEIAPGIPDGLKVDAQGNVWSSSKEGIQVFSASGELLGKIKVTAKDTGNLAFCSTGSQHWIYITAVENTRSCWW